MAETITSRTLHFFLFNPNAEPKEAAKSLGLKRQQIYGALYSLRQRGDIAKSTKKSKAVKLKSYFRKIVKTATSKNRPSGKQRLFAITWEIQDKDRERDLVKKIEKQFKIHLSNYNYSGQFKKRFATKPNPHFPKIKVGTE